MQLPEWFGTVYKIYYGQNRVLMIPISTHLRVPTAAMLSSTEEDPAKPQDEISLRMSAHGHSE